MPDAGDLGSSKIVPDAYAVPKSGGSRGPGNLSDALRQRGPFRAGDRVQLTDPRGRRHTIELRAGGTFHTHKGHLRHDDLIGLPPATVVTNTAGVEFLALRPLLADYVMSMPRGAAIVYPKDAGQILTAADIFPGAVVVEAGVGSGALTMYLLQAVGAAGALLSIERRADFAAIARGNVAAALGAAPANWRLAVGDFADVAVAVLAPGTADRVVLDLLAPWENLAAAATVLAPGGVFCAYVATTTQLSRLAESLRGDGRFTEPEAFETLVRTWHLEGLAVRPDHRMVAHTGFLLVARRLADGVVPPRRKRRPAKGAYPTEDLGSDPANPGPTVVPESPVMLDGTAVVPEATPQEEWSAADLGERPVSERKVRRVVRRLGGEFRAE